MKKKRKKGNFGLRGLARISRVCFFEGEALGREPEKTGALEALENTEIRALVVDGCNQ